MNLNASIKEQYNNQDNLEEELGWGNLLDSKAYYRTTTMKIVWYWQVDRQIDQRNGIVSPEIDPL